MRNYTDDYERGQKIRDYDIAVGNVQHVEDLRDRYEIQKGTANKEIMAMLDAIDSGEELSVNNNIQRVFDGSLDDFMEFVRQTNKDQFIHLEDEVDMLTRISEGLAKLKMEGVLNQLDEEGILTKDEVNAMASHHILDDAAEDLITATSKNILLARSNNDLISAIHSIRNTFDDNAYKFNFEDNPIIEKLQDLGVVEIVRSRGIIHEDADYNDGTRTDFRRSTERNYTPRNKRYSESRDTNVRTRASKYNDGFSRHNGSRVGGIDLPIRSSSSSSSRRTDSGRRDYQRVGKFNSGIRKTSRFSSRRDVDRNDRREYSSGRYERRDDNRDYRPNRISRGDRRRSFTLDRPTNDRRESRYNDRQPMPSSGTFSTLNFDQDAAGNRTIHINVDDDWN